jgi:type II secretory pathway pseudopilin PulG
MLELIIGLAIGYFVLGGIVSNLTKQALSQVQSVTGSAAEAAEATEEEEVTEEDPYPEDTEGLVFNEDYEDNRYY